MNIVIVRASLADINAVLIGKAIKCADALKIGQVIRIRDVDDRREIIAKIGSVNPDRGCVYFVNPRISPDFVPNPVVEKKPSKPKKDRSSPPTRIRTRTSKSIHVSPRRSKVFRPQTEIELQTPEALQEWKVALLQQRIDQKRHERLVKQRMEGA